MGFTCPVALSSNASIPGPGDPVPVWCKKVALVTGLLSVVGGDKAFIVFRMPEAAGSGHRFIANVGTLHQPYVTILLDQIRQYPALGAI